MIATVLLLQQRPQRVLYRAECVVQYEREPGGAADPDPQWYATQDFLLASASVARRVVQELRLHEDASFLGLSTRGKVHRPVEQAVRRLLEHLTVTRLEGTRLARVAFEDTDAARAARIANLVVDQYLKKVFEDRLEGNRHTAEWFSKQIEQTEEQLVRTEGELRAYVTKTPEAALAFDERQRLVALEIAQLDQERTEARIHTIKAAARAAKLKEAEATDPFAVNVSEVDENAEIKRLRAEHLDAILKYQGVVDGQGADSRLAELYRGTLDRLRDQLQSTIRGITRGAQAELTEAQQVELQLEAQWKRVNAAGQELQLQELAYGRFVRTRAATEALLATLRSQATARAAEASGAGHTNARVVEPATAPTEPVGGR